MTDDDSASGIGSNENQPGYTGPVNRTERTNTTNYDSNDFDMVTFCKQCFDIIDGNDAVIS